jgi:hypothetical protein
MVAAVDEDVRVVVVDVGGSFVVVLGHARAVKLPRSGFAGAAPAAIVLRYHLDKSGMSAGGCALWPGKSCCRLLMELPKPALAAFGQAD